jgi:hypothetical protein
MKRSRSLALSLAFGALACAAPIVPRIVEDEVHDVDPKMLAKIAVVPFAVSPEFRGGSAPGAARGTPSSTGTPSSGDLSSSTGNPSPTATGSPTGSSRPTPGGNPAPSGTQGPEAAALATKMASEAFAAAGFEVIPASDVAQVFEAAGQPVPRDDRVALGAAAAREFGATAVLSGTVYRYRERSGGELGTTSPASVGVELALHTVPDSRLLWSARFDHTQQALSENALVAPRYPGAGSRWLTAAELTRWGLDAAAKHLAEQR